MMMTISSYQLVEEIYESANSLVYRGLRNLDRQPVILKILKSDYPTPQEITRYKQEYEITRNLNKEGVVRVYGLENYQNRLVIILEDFGGESLKIWMKDQKFTLEEFLIIAIKITDSLSEIHASNIIHKDINPSNIVFNPATRQLKIIDFGIATLLSRENLTLHNPLVLEGTLAYISPEQTGRMNRAIDYRTDFYSLGVTFYELLTHQLPFDTTDAMELVHSHIALTPIAPHELNSDIPKAISDIVMKLLAKSAEERYQSAWGLKADFQKCLTQLQNQVQFTEFPLGSQDISDKFQIPQKLYGREKEVETLLAAFERVAAGGIGRGGDDNSQSSNPNSQSKILNPKSKIEMMLIAGYSGIGKSALVQELYKPITRLRGYFISGKFDQLQRNIPYSAFVNAFRGLVRQLLTESEVQLAQWREKLLAAFGSNGQVIIDVIPEMELIVGSQPPVAELGLAEAQNRFNLVFQNFIRVFCQPEHPLVIFLDDLQWSDLATLKLIELIMTDDQMQYLFLIGAYRDNEVSPIHPLMMTLEALRKEGAIANQITLSPLKLDYVTDLVAETLHSDTVSVKPLAELVVRKTKGNPFFVNQFLTTLYQENLLIFTPPGIGRRGHEEIATLSPNGGWQWDMAKIEAVDITDNVAELMSGKFKKLPNSTQQVSRLAACVGNHFNLNTLSLIYEKSDIETFQNLCPAIQEGLILPLSELRNSYPNVSSSDLLILDYKFLHDRVQQAAYALIDEDEKKAVHLRIGHLLLANLSTEERLERIFELVDHLNLGWELITGDREQVELAQLNLAAGQKAKDATAYTAARDYLTVGMERLSPDSWSQHYELMFALHKERAEVEYLNGNLESSQALIDVALAQAQSDIQKAELYTLLIVQYTLSAKYEDAIKAGRQALAMVGINLPEEDWSKERNAEIVEINKTLAEQQIESLIDINEVKSPEKRIAIKLLDKLISLAFYISKDLLFLIVAKIVKFSLQYGYAPESAFGHAWYGMYLASIAEDYKSGYNFGILARKLSERFNHRTQECKTKLILGCGLSSWVKPIKCSDDFHNEGYQAGLESGELEHAGHHLKHKLIGSFYRGVNLPQILADTPGFLRFTQKTKNQLATDSIRGFQLGLQNLCDLTSGKFSFDTEEISEVKYIATCQKHQSSMAICLYQILQSQIFYLYGRMAEALQCALAANKLLSFIINFISTAEHNFYYSLSLAALYPEVSEEVQKQYRQQLEANQKQMETWADNCPENFLHKYLLVEAEIARIFGQDLEAIDLYEYSIESARENEFIQNEALANELAAKFWLSRGKEKIAKVYMSEAHYGYQRWGAKRKVEDLEEKYPQLIVRTPSSANGIRTTLTSTTSNSTNSGSSVLDLATAIKASQVIYGEIVLDKLLAKLMKILIENAGAQKGYLILEKAGKLLIEAEGGVERVKRSYPAGNRITVLQSIPVSSDASVSLASSIINYVVRTKETVVLNDASREGKFTNDPYISQHQSKSILCTPLINQGKLISILYLENNLTTGAFTCDRVELLKLLSSQASISIESAQLYNNLQQFNQNLEQLVDERTTELSQTLANLKATQTQLVEAEKMAALGGLVAGVAHEINTPLGIGVTAASLLADKSTALSEAFKSGKMKRSDLEKYLDTATSSATLILSNLSRAAELIQSFKQVAVDQSCEKQRTFGVKAYLQEILLNLRPKLKRTKLTIEIHGDENLTLDSYPGAFSQIVTNLVMNSLIHAYEPEDEGRIVLEFQQNNEQFIFQYCDDGKGIPKENLSKIFEPFFTTKRGQGGSGLGLHIIYNLVTQRLKGTIQCESQVGSGTSFLLEFPIQADSDK